MPLYLRLTGSIRTKSQRASAASISAIVFINLCSAGELKDDLAYHSVLTRRARDNVALCQLALLMTPLNKDLVRGALLPVPRHGLDSARRRWPFQSRLLHDLCTPSRVWNMRPNTLSFMVVFYLRPFCFLMIQARRSLTDNRINLSPVTVTGTDLAWNGTSNLTVLLSLYFIYQLLQRKGH